MAIDNAKTFEITMLTLVASMEPIMSLMRDDNIFEVYVNENGKIWTDSLQGRECTDITMTADTRRQVILNVAALTGQVVTDERPQLEAEIPPNDFFDKCRFQGVLPAVTSAPVFNIRKQPKKIFTLDDYVTAGIMSEVQHQVILKAIKEKKNIIAAGGTKSGKTTLLNAILCEISKSSDRVILIEDTPELKCTAKDTVFMKTMPTYSMHDCLRSVLRMTPDRIVVGEVRGEEALYLLDAWSTGHGGGCSTVHSNSAKDTLLRLENMTTRTARQPQQATIGQAVHLIIYLKYLGTKRVIEEIIEIRGYNPSKKDYDIVKIA